MHTIYDRYHTSQQDASDVVFSPRVLGEEPPRMDQSFKGVSPTLIKERLEKSGMAFKAPGFVERTIKDSRDVWKNKFKPRACSPGHHRASRTLRLKSTAPGLVTVPLSAKQWLLQSLGLKDSEIYELFHQMESMPQFAAEYIREVKEEWQAMEMREMKRPPEVDYLSKDQALIEKVRALILRVVRIHDSEDLALQAHESQMIKEREKNASSSRARSPCKPVQMQMEKNKHEFQHAHKADNLRSLRSDQELIIQESDYTYDLDKSSSVICSSCGQPRIAIGGSQLSMPASSVRRDSAPQLRHVLPSFIPVDDYIVEQCVVQPELHGKVEHKSRFSPLDKRWYMVLFPALQPGKREDVQLLAEWLQHSMQRNCHENSDGQFEDPETAFILHSIAFLEIVRQVDLQCEERGNLLLHVWRQILRVFNQVMAAVEPYIDAKEDELKRAEYHMDNMNEQINNLLRELDQCNRQFKEKEIQLQKIKRCRLCLCENVTPRSREDIVKKAKAKASLLKRSSQGAHPQLQPSHSPSQATYPEVRKEEESVEVSKRAEAHETSKRVITGNKASFIQEADKEDRLQTATTVGKNSPVPHDDSDGDPSSPPQLVEDNSSEPPIPDRPSYATQEEMGAAFDIIRVENATQTSEKQSHNHLLRCASAPGRLQHDAGESPSLTGHKETETSVKVYIPSKQAKAAEEEANFLKLLGPPAAGSIPIPGTIIGAAIDRLQNFENLAIETICLLEKLPKIEGNLAATVQSLTENYCKLTGYVLKQPERDGKGPESAVEGERDIQQENEPDSEKGKKKGKGKSIQAKFYVPASFSKMMKINSVPKNLKTFNTRQVTKLLASVYSSKIEADAVDDAANNERQSCSEFMYDFMLNLYGLKGIAESAIHGLFKTVKGLITSKQMDKHHKIRLFSKFVGMENESFGEQDLYIYLKLLQRGLGKACAILPSDQDDGLVFLNHIYVDYVLDEPNLIEFIGSEGAAREVAMKFASKYLITEKASPEIKKLVKENEVRKLDWDHLVETLLESRPRSQAQVRRQSVQKSVNVKATTVLTEEKLQELVNLFIAGDANQDGVLTFTEFREIISTAEPSISTQSALRMFRQTLLLMPDGGDSISPQAFAKIAHEHGISAPPAVVFALLRKTWNQVQSDINEEKMQEDFQRQEFENLKNTLLSLLADQQEVTRAVQVFRDLVLKFCGDDEGEGAEQDNNLEDDAEEETED
ncbi:hypothetical protein KP509_31G008600 [Ceratopteris richardii]|nr:hypothetical protein KP509_31G008600 [Ceratopteris richardii]KAH7288035.1 hypothetical protein KP509_31G008600 [Ceratopteris richardii]